MTKKLPPTDWTAPFTALYQAALVRYSQGARIPSALIESSEEQSLLDSIGITRQVLFDYAEDDTDLETVLLVAALRRDYFWFLQHGEPSSKQLPEPSFPRKTDEIDGIPWLPRIILKAQCFLRGELPDNLMYGCGGDRNFCRKHKIHLAELLHYVWLGGKDAQSKCVALLRSRE